MLNNVYSINRLTAYAAVELRMHRDHSFVSSFLNLSLYMTLRKVLVLLKSAIRLQLDTLLVRKRTINYLANTWLHLSGGKTVGFCHLPVQKVLHGF